MTEEGERERNRTEYVSMSQNEHMCVDNWSLNEANTDTLIVSACLPAYPHGAQLSSDVSNTQLYLALKCIHLDDGARGQETC